jgi:hypothetical protein
MMVMVRMRTIKERQELTDSPEAHSLMCELRAIARSHVRLFQLVENFGESDEPADRRLEPEHGGIALLHRDTHFDKLAEVLTFENVELPES